MSLLLHGVAIASQFLVDDGELVPVSAVNARSAFLMVMPGCEGLWRRLVMERLPMVYQLDSHGEQIAVYE